MNTILLLVKKLSRLSSSSDMRSCYFKEKLAWNYLLAWHCSSPLHSKQPNRHLCLTADFARSLSMCWINKRINYYFIPLADCCLLQLFVLYKAIMMIAKETTCEIKIH